MLRAFSIAAYPVWLISFPDLCIFHAVVSLISVQDDDYKYLMFEDHLATVSDTGKELGEFSVSIEPTKHKGQECFLVHANSHGAIDGVPCGTSITAYVGNSLETIEQQHHEYVKVRPNFY